MTVESPWSRSSEDVCAELSVDGRVGLAGEEAARRRERYGANQLVESAPVSPLRRFLMQFADTMIGLLAVAAAISGLIGEWADATLIGLIVLGNAGIGFVQESRAERAIAALKRLSQPVARVRRSGRLEEIPASEIVPGDVIELTAGGFVPADARLSEAPDLEIDESALTGESLAVEKSPLSVPPETGLPDRSSMVHSGTVVVRGHGRAVVTGTGMTTQLGNIASLLAAAEFLQTPLQQRLDRLSKRLAVIVVAVCLLIFAAGILREQPENWNRQLTTRMLLTAVSLAVAAIPEGLPAVITVTLALGAQRMANRNAIVRSLSAVETLGSVDVICSDKTGTLTQNRMAVQELVAWSESDEAANELLTAGVLCNDASISEDGTIVGTATESAIVQTAVDRGINLDDSRAQCPRLAEIPFSSARKRMTTLHRRPDGKFAVYSKGAAEQMIQRATEFGGLEHPDSLGEKGRALWRERAEELASRGRRVLAVAARPWQSDNLPDDPEEVESRFCLIGLLGIVDPVRPEARESIARCRSAGIRPVMITGDHRRTAEAIADDLQLRRPGDLAVEGSQLDAMDDTQLRDVVQRAVVYSRVSPEHKLRIVRALQATGCVVAMTGDGVNDAPALKQAEIGVVMGVTGTDVAKEASEMILADDNFATIVAAVEEGRVVYDNIRKFVGYLLTANTGEILVLTFAIAAGLPLPLLPIHILWINLVTDGLPALALGFEPAERDVMTRQPRAREESIFADGLLKDIMVFGFWMAAACMLLFVFHLGGREAFGGRHADVNAARVDYARTVVFVTLSMFQLFYVLAVRSTSQLLVEHGLWSNYRLAVAVLIGAALQLAVVYVPWCRPFFHTVPLAPSDLAAALAVSTTAFLGYEAVKWLRRRSSSRAQPAA